MKRLGLVTASALVLFTPYSALHASGDYGCDPNWTIASRNLDCASRGALSPGNDSRVNLLFLLRDKAGLANSGSYAKQDWDTLPFGRTFLDWKFLRATLYPQPGSTVVENEYNGRCASLTTARPAFASAIAASSSVPANERALLVKARERLVAVCTAGGSPDDASNAAKPALPAWPDGIVSEGGKEWLTYLKGGYAFYAMRWDEARSSFAALGTSREVWLAETAVYMLARIDLNAAQANSFNQWGDFEGPEKVDRTAAARAGAALVNYLKAFPQGRYAASAQGLVRRALWLSGDLTGLARAYEQLLGSVAAGTDIAPDLVEEIDNKLLFADGITSKADGPLVLATLDLMAMRGGGLDDDGQPVSDRPVLTTDQLAAQEKYFTTRPELFSFLQANHAFYVAQDYARVLQLVPDDARKPRYDNLAFSRQVLRGQALAALGDRNEAGFWRELLGGAGGLWQRPAAELGLALNLEKNGRLADVFAANSPITDQTVREVLLSHSAGPDILRANAANAARSQHERDAAIFTLLYKELTRGRYADFVADLKLVGPKASTDFGFWNFGREEVVPAGIFTKGRWSDGYACPALATTAATLSKVPMDVKARLCLGDFLRINDFDGFTVLDSPPEKGTLGSHASLFPGKPLARAEIYRAIIADPKAHPNDKAYALYRALRCYASAGNNGCGGDEVEQSQRKAWFIQLKKSYPASPWAKKLSVYW